MDNKKIKNEIDSLRQTIAWHQYKYYTLDDPEISDAEYDALLRELIKLEKDYPEFVKISQENFSQLVKIVEVCQGAGVLKRGASDVVAVSLWSTVHGFTSLLLEGQISHTVLEEAPLNDLLINII